MKRTSQMKATLESMVQAGGASIRNHPVSQKAGSGWSSEERLRYTLAQYGFAVVWPGFLGSLGDSVKNSALKKAFKANAACEIGLNGVSHVYLARRFAITQGISPNQIDESSENPVVRDSMGRMFGLLDTDNDAHAGAYLWAQEVLAGAMFEACLPAFEQVSGCDCTYLKVHIEVDGQDHGPQIMAGVEELLTEATFPEVKCAVETAIAARFGYLQYIQTGHLKG